MTGDSVKRRMLRPASGPSPATAAGIGRIWGNAVARVAEDRLGLPVEAGSASIAGAGIAGFLSAISSNAMLLRLDGRSGAQGLALVGSDAVAALVEMHTMRRLRQTAPDPRPPTRTDAAIVSPILDEALAMLTASADDGLVPKWAAGWSVAAFAPDPRPLGLTMPDIAYRRITLPLIFGLDRARSSDLSLLVPDGGAGIGLPRPDEPPENWQERLGRAAMPAPAEVRGVLWRLRMPLAAVIALKTGDSLTILEDAIDAVRVEAADGRCLAVGRLGQLRGDRAVRLREFAGPDGEIGPAGDGSAALPPGGAGAPGGGSGGALGGASGGAAGGGSGRGAAGRDALAEGFMSAGLPTLDSPAGGAGGGLGAGDLGLGGETGGMGTTLGALPLAADAADGGMPALAFPTIGDLPDRID